MKVYKCQCHDEKAIHSAATMTYRIRQQEIWDTYTLVEAGSEEEAITKAKDGYGDMVHSEYNRQNDMFHPTVED